MNFMIQVLTVISRGSAARLKKIEVIKAWKIIAVVRATTWLKFMKSVNKLVMPKLELRMKGFELDKHTLYESFIKIRKQKNFTEKSIYINPKLRNIRIIVLISQCSK